MTRRSKAVRMVAGVSIVPVAAAVLLGIEIQIARRGDRVPKFDRPALDDLSASGASLSVWLGDSTAAGDGASDVAHTLPHQVASNGDPVRLQVLAVSGARVADVIADQLPKLDGLQPDRVYLSIGANDVVHLTSRDDYREQFQEIVRAMKATGAQELVVLGIGEYATTVRLPQPLRLIATWRAHTLSDVNREIADNAGATYVDIAGETGDEIGSDPARYLAKDRYHPSDDGYRLWANAVVKATR